MGDIWDNERRKVWGAIIDIKKQLKELKIANKGTTEGGRVEGPGLYHGGNLPDTLKEGAPGGRSPIEGGS